MSAPAVERRAWLLPAALSLAIVALGSLPYAYGYWSAPPGERFMGFVGRGTPGANSYFMMARQVQEGHDRIVNLYTSEPTGRAYFHFEWWAFGFAARVTGLSLEAVFHLGRALSVTGFVFAAWWLVRLMLERRWQRNAALLLICTGSGFGWAVWLAARFGLALPPPLDLEGVSAPGYLVNNPHFIRAGLFAALQYAFLVRGLRSGRWGDFACSGLAMCAQSMVRPFHVPETYGVCLIFPLLLGLRQGRPGLRAFLQFGLALAVHTPMLLWHAYIFAANPLHLGPWLRQAEFLLMQTLWLGLPFALCVAVFAWRGLGHVARARPERLLLGLWLALAWAVTNTFPLFGWAHEGLFGFILVPPILAMAILGDAAWGEDMARRWPAARRLAAPAARAGLAAAIVAAGLPTSALVQARFFTRLHRPTGDWSYYLSSDYRAAIDWLEGHTPEGAVVLASVRTGQFIPRLIDRHVVAGQDILTRHYHEKTLHIARFYETLGDDGFKRWMARRYGVTHAVIGPNEARADGAQPADHPWLEPVFRAGAVTVYAVRPDS